MIIVLFGIAGLLLVALYYNFKISNYITRLEQQNKQLNNRCEELWDRLNPKER